MEIVLELPRDIDKLCRTCMNLVDNDSTSSNFIIFDNKQTELCAMLQTVTSLKINVQDDLPTSLCSRCTEQLKFAYTFILQCTQVDENLRNILHGAKGINGETSSVTNPNHTSLNISENDLTCKVCEKSFTTYYELSRHLIVHNSSKSIQQRFEESACNEGNNYNSECLSEEIEKQTLLINECRNNLSVQNAAKTMTGEIKNNKNLLHCDDCNENFQSEENLYLHNCKKSVKEGIATHKPALCSLCGKKCEDFSSLSLHFLSHALALEIFSGNMVSELYFCEICGQLFENDSSLSDHYLIQHENRPTWECLECNEIFDKEKDILSHNSFIHEYDVEDVDFKVGIQCVLCSENFYSKSDLHKHSLSHLMKRYACRKCPLSFCTQYSYFLHFKVHTDGKHICSLCGKFLSTSSALKSHIDGVHSVDLQHCCSICGKCFATITRLKTHSKIHTSEKKYICSYCGYSSHKSGDLVIHTRIHTSERPYKCTFPNCTMSFKTSSHLCHHVRRHLQIKKHKCTVCLMKFATNHGLKIHQMQHTGEKPHPCIVCKKTFRRKYHLKVHMRQHNRS